MDRTRNSLSRREFLGALTVTTGAGLVGAAPRSASAEAPPETTRIRLSQTPVLCVAPQYVASELLRAEGFSEVQYVKRDGNFQKWQRQALPSGEIDIMTGYVTTYATQIDAGDPIVLLAGVHVGCYELVGTERVGAIRDLRGRKVAVPEPDSAHQLFVSMMAAHVGLDPRRDIEWVVRPPAEAQALLVDGKVDALMAFPPEAQELRARKIGHVVVASALDRPWSQYFCCVVAGNKQFVQKNPVATKRAIRAILKATDLCAAEPERSARFLVDRGFARNYEILLQMIKDLPYNRWRELDPADAVRFYALRLHEAGVIKASPQKIIAQGTDWRFFNELKKELKG
jgi:NitT/TauT family transport system substrate-binding protein